MIDKLFSESWLALIDCNIEYHGTALGLLDDGVYLILRKPDGSVSVQAGNKNQPRNYIRSKHIEILNDKIICHNKKEKLIININKIIMVEMISLSTHEVKITRTEKELVGKLERQLRPLHQYADIIREYTTENGKIDLAIEYSDEILIYEAKRRIVTTKDVFQLIRYAQCINKHHKLYLVGPSISKNALKSAEKNNVEFIELTWDQPNAQDTQQ